MKEREEKLSKNDTDWIALLEETIKVEMPNFDFTAQSLAAKMAMSIRSLEMKTKSLTGFSPRKYIQEVRLKEAFLLIEEREIESIKELAFRIGMKDRSNFSRLFKKRFGHLPSTILKRRRW